MQKFSHGDKVTCTICGTKITDAKIIIDEDGTPHICQNNVSGADTASEKFGYKCSWKLSKDFTDAFVKDLKLVEEPEMETVTVKRYGAILNGNLQYMIYEDSREWLKEYKEVELTISYQIPKVKTMTKEEAEKLLNCKIV